MNKSIINTTIQVAALAAAIFTVGCSAPIESEHSEVGELSLALRTTVDGTSYELDAATFRITGTTSIDLDADGDAETLEQELPVGEYSLELLAGWQLLRVSEEGSEPLTATLTSPNPLPFTIVDGETTSVSYRFEFEGDELELGSGVVEITIDVAEATARSVIFTELMSNPAAVGDSDGEWLELHNAGTAPVELEGCVVERDSTSFTIGEALTLEPGETVVLANGDAPGFTADYVYSSVTLPNSAVFVLNLRCDEELLDTIEVDPSAWPGASGVAASLSAGSTDFASNDDPANWCDATAPYNGDLGTPGEENPTCSP